MQIRVGEQEPRECNLEEGKRKGIQFQAFTANHLTLSTYEHYQKITSSYQNPPHRQRGIPSPLQAILNPLQILTFNIKSTLKLASHTSQGYRGRVESSEQV